MRQVLNLVPEVNLVTYIGMQDRYLSKVQLYLLSRYPSVLSTKFSSNLDLVIVSNPTAVCAVYIVVYLKF
eukprot:SAG31_NODE_292_length_18283_cov_10.859859_4_plen_70_part_00